MRLHDLAVQGPDRLDTVVRGPVEEQPVGPLAGLVVIAGWQAGEEPAQIAARVTVRLRGSGASRCGRVRHPPLLELLEYHLGRVGRTGDVEAVVGRSDAARQEHLGRLQDLGAVPEMRAEAGPLNLVDDVRPGILRAVAEPVIRGAQGHEGG